MLLVMSSNDERDVVMECLSLGAVDYLVKPLRHNELRQIWTRVWWWRRVGGMVGVDGLDNPSGMIIIMHFVVQTGGAVMLSGGWRSSWTAEQTSHLKTSTFSEETKW
jgi:hypothetical protein